MAGLIVLKLRSENAWYRGSDPLDVGVTVCI